MNGVESTLSVTITKTKVFSDRHLTVYEICDENTSERQMMRSIQGSDVTEAQVDAWFDNYENYQLTVTNYKYLPRILSVNYGDDEGVHALLENDSGKTLTSVGQLTKEQVEQLIDAVSHLHRKNYLHGSITADNVWVTDVGRVVLYGAGEWKALSRGECSLENDIGQLVDVVARFGLISEETADFLMREKISSLGQLGEYVISDKVPSKIKGFLTEKKSKSGLVEKEPEFVDEITVEATPVVQSDVLNKRKQKQRYKIKQKQRYEKEENVHTNPYREQEHSVDLNQAQFSGFWRRFFAIVIDGLILTIPAQILFGDAGVGLIILFGWIYCGLMESSKYQATLGKKILKMKVVDGYGNRITFKRAVARNFSKVLSMIILGIGFFMASFTKRKQGLHDYIANTVVISSRKL